MKLKCKVASPNKTGKQFKSKTEQQTNKQTRLARATSVCCLKIEEKARNSRRVTNLSQEPTPMWYFKENENIQRKL